MSGGTNEPAGNGEDTSRVANQMPDSPGPQGSPEGIGPIQLPAIYWPITCLSMEALVKQHSGYE